MELCVDKFTVSAPSDVGPMSESLGEQLRQELEHENDPVPDPELCGTDNSPQSCRLEKNRLSNAGGLRQVPSHGRRIVYSGPSEDFGGYQEKATTAVFDCNMYDTRRQARDSGVLIPRDIPPADSYRSEYWWNEEDRGRYDSPGARTGGKSILYSVGLGYSDPNVRDAEHSPVYDCNVYPNSEIASRDGVLAPGTPLITTPVQGDFHFKLIDRTSPPMRGSTPNTWSSNANDNEWQRQRIHEDPQDGQWDGLSTADQWSWLSERNVGYEPWGLRRHNYQLGVGDTGDWTDLRIDCGSDSMTLPGSYGPGTRRGPEHIPPGCYMPLTISK